MSHPAEMLTPQVLFGSKPLLRAGPQDVRFTPDGTAITFRAADTSDRERFNLHRLELGGDADATTPWIDAARLALGDQDITSLSAEERSARERQRDFSFGITAYAWRPQHDHELLLPLGGTPCLLDTRADDPTATLRPLTAADDRQSAFRFSPAGRYLSYVQSRDLYVVEVDSGTVIRITDDASETVSSGIADFLAAEEMHRFEGHWWAPDEMRLYFTRVDESPVEVSHRLEIDATGSRTIAQRYPFAGATNPRVSLWCHDLAAGTTLCIWEDDAADAYLARVNFCGAHLIAQFQNRLQNRLMLRAWSGEAWTALHDFESATWINLTNDFVALGATRFLCSAEFADSASGLRELVEISTDGSTAPRRFAGPGHITRLHAVHNDVAWVSGWSDDPTQNHLFGLSLSDGKWSDGSCEQISTVEGWHEFELDDSGTRYLDIWTTPDEPGGISVHSLVDGAEVQRVFEDRITPDHPYAPFRPRHVVSTFGTIAAEDGQTLHYRLTPPAEVRGEHATIVYVYGGPGAQKVRRTFGPLLLQLFATHGFGVLELDNRGSTNRGAKFEAPLYRSMGTVEVADQITGLEILDQVPWANRDRVGVFGHSYGGYMSLMCLSQAPDHFAAGVAVAPVCDWSLYDSHYTERYMGLPDDNPEGYRHGNVLTHLEQLRAPLLLMHGMADDNVLFSNSTKIMAELQRLDQPFELMTYPGAKHSMQEPFVNTHRFNMILAFFDRHLNRARNA